MAPSDLTTAADLDALRRRIAELERENEALARRAARTAEAEAARHVTESRFRALFEQFPLSVQIFAPDGRTLTVNRAWHDLFRLSLAELDGFNPLTDPQLAPVREHLRRGFAGEIVTIPPHPFEPSGLGSNGEQTGARPPVWLEVTVWPVRDGDGSIREVIVVHRDVTERMEAEEALRASEESYRTLFELAGDAMFVHDIETGAVLDANRNACELHGCSLDELRELGIGGISDGRPPYDAEHARAYVRRAAAGEPQRFEWLVRDRNGEPVWVEVHLLRVRILGEERVLASVRNITERKAAEGALQRAYDELEARVEARTAELALAEQRFRAIVEASPTPLLLSRVSDGVILYANDRVEALIGAAPGSLDGRNTPDFYYDPADRPGILQAIRERGYVRDLELRIRRSDGTPRWVSLTVQRMVFDGEPTLATSLLDITERKESEVILRERTAELEGIFRALPDLYFRMEADGTILSYRAGRAFGLYVPPEEFLGRRVQDVLPPPVGPRIAEALAEVERTGDLVHFDYVLPLGDERRDFEARLLPLDGGQVIAVVRDVTERKAAELALLASEESYRGLFDALTEFVYIQDLEGRFLAVNEAVVRAYGYRREELVGQFPTLLGAPGTVDPEAFAATFARAVAGEPQRFEWWGRRKDGSVFPKEVVIKRSTYFGQEVIIAVARDITERKRDEEALRLQKTLLEAQGEASIDGILVVSPSGEMLSCNRRFVEMWGIPDEVAASGSDAAAIAAVLRCLDDPDGFLARVAYLYEHPDEESRDEIRLRDGRVFDRYSAPVRSNEGDHYGRIWFFRDITDRKRDEEALRASHERERQHAQRLEEELEVGRRIQRSFLPAEIVRPTGWEVEARFHPASQVAGDFYDTFALPIGRIGLIVADVCGKGVGAALFMALFRSLLRAHAERASTSRMAAPHATEAVLHEAMHATNRYIHRVHRPTPQRNLGHTFASVFFGLLDPETGALHYVNAGHEPPAILGPDGVRLRLRPTGPALGLIDGAKLEVEHALLAPGETLLAYTDGVTEARDGGRAFFDEHRLLALLEEPAPSAAHLLDRIERAVHTFTGPASQADDVTLLAVRRGER